MGRFPIFRALSVLLYLGGGITLFVAIILFLAAWVSPVRDTSNPFAPVAQFGGFVAALSVAATGLSMLITAEGLRWAVEMDEHSQAMVNHLEQITQLLRPTESKPTTADNMALKALRDELAQLRFNTERTANATEVLSGTVQRRNKG